MTQENKSYLLDEAIVNALESQQLSSDDALIIDSAVIQSDVSLAFKDMDIYASLLL